MGSMLWMTCISCGRLFGATNTLRQECSDDCRIKHENGRFGVQSRRPVGTPIACTKTCIVCGAEFQATGKTVLCSDECRGERIKALKEQIAKLPF